MATKVVNDQAKYLEQSSGPRRYFNDQPQDIGPDYVKVHFDWLTPSDYNTTDWTTVKDAGATVAVGTDALGGELLLSSAATTDNDGASIQSIQECFKLSSGKKLWLSTKVKLADADQTDFFVGLGVAFATDPENATASANRIGFRVNDGDASLLCECVKASSAQTIDSGVDLSDATYVTLEMAWDGSSKVEFFVDRSKVAEVTTATPTVAMALVHFHLSGDASGTKTSTSDYLSCVMER